MLKYALDTWIMCSLYDKALADLMQQQWRQENMQSKGGSLSTCSMSAFVGRTPQAVCNISARQRHWQVTVCAMNCLSVMLIQSAVELKQGADRRVCEYLITHSWPLCASFKASVMHPDHFETVQAGR